MDADQRVSTAERQTAIDALTVHTRAGRISGAEYEDRSQAAKAAVTWQDLTGLFADLPEPHPVPDAATPAAATPAPMPAPAPPAPQHQGLIQSPYGPVLVSLSPFIALALFLVTHQWWWFLLIPVMGLVVRGPHDDRHGRRHH